jgi:hypothetical protein
LPFLWRLVHTNKHYFKRGHFMFSSMIELFLIAVKVPAS